MESEWWKSEAREVKPLTLEELRQAIAHVKTREHQIRLFEKWERDQGLTNGRS